jgi:hypothetical protein
MKEAIWEMAGLLQRDCERAGHDLEKDDSPYSRRTYVCTIFRSLEAVVSLMKQVALERATLFTAEEIEKLREERPPFLPLKDAVAFASGMYSKAMGSPFCLDKGGREWAAFTKAIGVRNGLTHPKQLESLNISPSDIEAVGLAYRMVVSVMIDSLVQGVEAQHRELLKLCEEHGV